VDQGNGSGGGADRHSREPETKPDEAIASTVEVLNASGVL